MIDGFIALYIFMLAAFTGYEVIARVPVILHTPLMSGSNFVHGIVLVGAMVAMGRADTTLELTIAFVGVVLAAGNAVGGYAVTERMLEMFKSSKGKALMGTHRRRHGDSGELLRRGRAVHLRLEAHELAGHGAQRHRLGRRRHGRRDADHVPDAGHGQLRADDGRDRRSAASRPGSRAGASR